MSSTSLYVDIDTPVHRLAGRAKLALAAGLSVAAFVFADPLWVGSVLAVAFVGLIGLGGWRNFKRIWYIVVALVVVSVLVWPAFAPAGGAVIIDVAFLRITALELRFALGRSARIASFLLVGLGVVTTTSNEELVAALRSLGLPYAFCFAVGTALRLFPTFIGAAGTVRQAQAARGHDLSAGHPIKRLRKYVPVLIPVFMTAFRQVGTQSMALEARGFDAGSERTFYNRRSFRTADWLATGIALVVAVGSIGLSALGYGVL
jgi:energy-coupling factor transporter transmembrane protein EcfT